MEPHTADPTLLVNGSGGSASSEEETTWLQLTNFSNVVSSSTSWFDNESSDELISSTVVPSNDGGHCEEWQNVQHTLFQAANLCYAVAFLVPHTFKWSILITRLVLCCGYVVSSVWAGGDVCAPDVFIWHTAFVIINLTHTTYLAYSFFPTRVNPQLRELYAKLFEPLQMDKKEFKTLVRDAKVLLLEEGSTYAVEDRTRSDQRLSILLRGRLKVTCDNNQLHQIHPNHFIDSPEWEAASDQLFQVTITAEEQSCYVCWSRPRLLQVLKVHPFLQAVIHNLVGKDVTYKLYSLNENVNPKTRRAGEWSANWRSDPVARSLSMDAVQMGTKGQLRSQLWPAHLRRESSTGSESLGNLTSRSLMRRLLRYQGGYEPMALQSDSQVYVPQIASFRNTLKLLKF